MNTNDGIPVIQASSEADSAASPQPGEKPGTPVSEIEKKLMAAAEELGTWLGTAERRTTEFFAQQPTITDQLVRIRDTAARLLTQIEKGRERSR